MAKATAPWSVRTVRAGDKTRLAGFICADATVAWEREVEEYVQRGLLAWVSEPRAVANDPRALLLLARTSGDLIGVAAHERAEVHVPQTGTVIATRLEVVAIAKQWQGQRLGGTADPKASDVLMSAIMRDIQTRPNARSNLVFATVHQANVRSLAMCRRFGLVREMSKPNADYVRLIT